MRFCLIVAAALAFPVGAAFGYTAGRVIHLLHRGYR